MGWKSAVQSGRIWVEMFVRDVVRPRRVNSTFQTFQRGGSGVEGGRRR